MFEQTFKNIDDVLWKEADCTTELGYIAFALALAPITRQEAVGLVDEDGKARYPLKELRHVRASLEIDQQANPKEIKNLMGHSSIKVTYDVYGHLFEDHTERRAQRAVDIENPLTAV